MAVKSKHETFRKRPKVATWQRLAEMRAKGLSYAAIGDSWHVSRAAVFGLYSRHRAEVDAMMAEIRARALTPTQ